jgi:hypothetical protein
MTLLRTPCKRCTPTGDPRRPDARGDAGRRETSGERKHPGSRAGIMAPTRYGAGASAGTADDPGSGSTVAVQEVV